MNEDTWKKVDGKLIYSKCIRNKYMYIFSTVVLLFQQEQFEIRRRWATLEFEEAGSNLRSRRQLGMLNTYDGFTCIKVQFDSGVKGDI